MAKQPKLLFNGATYYLTGTCEPKTHLCKTDDEYAIFLNTLEETTIQFGWTLYAYCLTKETYHLLIDTPQGNLSDCMRYFQSTYSNRVHRSRGTCGHFFRNYGVKYIEATGENLANVSTLIHLEPARKKLIGLPQGNLSDYPRSSYRFYLRPSDRPDWLSVLPVLNALDFSDDRSGLTRYRNLLKKLLTENTTVAGAFKLSKPYTSIQKEWATGSDEFKNKLLDLLEKKLNHISSTSLTGDIKKAYELRVAEQQLQMALSAVGLSRSELKHLKKLDIRKQAVCWHLKQHTAARSAWIAKQLHMGTPSSTSLAARNVNQAVDGPLLVLRNTLQAKGIAGQSL